MVCNQIADLYKKDNYKKVVKERIDMLKYFINM